MTFGWQTAKPGRPNSVSLKDRNYIFLPEASEGVAAPGADVV